MKTFLFKHWPLLATVVLVTSCVMCTMRPAHAAGATATVNWFPPITYTTGEALPADHLKEYTLSWTRKNGASAGGSVTVPAGTLTASVPTPCGDYDFSITVTTNAAAKYPNKTSDATGPVPYASGIVCTQKPTPPGGLKAS